MTASAFLIGPTAVKVLFNDEFEVVGSVRLNRAIATGDEVAAADIESVEDLYPSALDPNAGWACLVVLPDGRATLAFDFCRNRDRSRQRLVRAEEYTASAIDALTAGRLGPALDMAHAAAELAIAAETLLMDTEEVTRGGKGRRPHSKRQAWLAQWTKLGNAPSEFSKTFGRLSQVRARARYAEGELDVTTEEAHDLVASVGAMIKHTKARAVEARRGAGPAADLRLTRDTNGQD